MGFPCLSGWNSCKRGRFGVLWPSKKERECPGVRNSGIRLRSDARPGVSTPIRAGVVVRVWEILGPPVCRDGIRASVGDSGFLDPARRRASVQVCEVRGSPRTPNMGFPCPSGRAWKCWVLVSTRTEFVQAGGFGIPLFGRARVREVRDFVVRPDPSFRVPLFVRTDTVQV